MEEIDRELAEAVILGHYRTPKNKGTCKEADGNHCCSGNTTNPACGDEITLSLSLNTQGKITCIRFEGQGCAVSQAGASMVTTTLEENSKEEAINQLKHFLSMMDGNEDTAAALDALGEIGFLGVLRENPARTVCATLAARLAVELLEQP